MNEQASQQTDIEKHIPEPQSIEESGLTMGFLADLALKLVYFQSEMTSGEISERIALPYPGIMEHVLNFLKRENLIEITSTRGIGETGYRWVVTGKGSDRALQALNRNRYMGPAPVQLERYNEMVHHQRLGEIRVSPADVRDALSHLVLPQALLDKVGPAVNSGRALFLYGPPGNGKTAIAQAIIRMLKGNVYIPYAIIVDGQIIRVFDEVNHRPVPNARNNSRRSVPGRRDNGPLDRRWLLIRRPEIIVGGELIMESLDLVYDPISKTYEAPFQLRANTGLFVIDDFGRQAMRPQDLLNRWIVPLEERVDYLTLQTGKKIEIPFDQLTVFATNLDPRDLVDDAFLRRIRHKLKVDFPSEELYWQIMKRACARRDMEVDVEQVRHLLQHHYRAQNRRLRACHPRDLLEQIRDISSYRGVPPVVSQQMLDAACEGYFADI